VGSFRASDSRRDEAHRDDRTGAAGAGTAGEAPIAGASSFADSSADSAPGSDHGHGSGARSSSSSSSSSSGGGKVDPGEALREFAGRWRKDLGASTSQDAHLKAIGVPWLVRAAIGRSPQVSKKKKKR
jgi:hypothetical protein